MKRSFESDKPSLIIHNNYEEGNNSIKRQKRSISSSSLAAMTLLSLAKHHSEQGLPSEGRRTPAIVPFDDDEKDNSSSSSDHDEIPFKSFDFDIPYKSFDFDCCEMKGNWRTIYRPLPLPPKLPRCRAGALVQ